MRESIKQIDGAQFDVAIIGGGINGAAGAQQLAARGYKVLLVDKGDFGSGASSRSSRLLHCGLRYLAPGTSVWEFVKHPSRFATGMRMARLAIDARHDFIQTTAKRAQLSRLYFPIFKGGAYSGWQVDAAFAILKYFNRGKVPLNYRRLKGDQARAVPLVSVLRDLDQLESVASYDEFQIAWPERVTADVALDAQRMGAYARNYTAAEIVGRTGDDWEVRLVDVDTGEEASVSARSVVNTAGIWIDKVFAKHRQGKNPKVLGTKGSHIVVKLGPEYRGTGIATINRKNEPFYCLPWGEFHYLGPTELVYDEDLDAIKTKEVDRDWLLGEANYLFPKLNLTTKDVIFTWSGVRPLTWDAALPKGNRNRVLHDLSEDGLNGVYAMTGGPLMTHRSAGVEIADAVSGYLGKTGKPAPSNPKTPSYASTFPRREEADILATLRGDVPAPQWLLHTLKNEQVNHLSDVIMRRSGVIWYHKITDDDVNRIAENIGKLAGWDNSRVLKEIERFKKEFGLLQGINN